MSNTDVDERLGAVETFVRSMATDINTFKGRLWSIDHAQITQAGDITDMKAVQAVHTRDLSNIADKLDAQARELTEVKAVQAVHTEDIGEIKAVQAVHTRDISEIKAVQAVHTKDIGEIKAVQAVHTKDLADIKVTLEGHSGKLEWLEKDSDARHSAVVKMLQEVLYEVRSIK